MWRKGCRTFVCLTRRLLKACKLSRDILDDAKLGYKLCLGAQPLLTQLRLIKRTQVLLDLCYDAIKVHQAANAPNGNSVKGRHSAVRGAHEAS